MGYATILLYHYIAFWITWAATTVLTSWITKLITMVTLILTLDGQARTRKWPWSLFNRLCSWYLWYLSRTPVRSGYIWVRVIRASRAQTSSRSVQYRITPYILHSWKMRYATNGGLGDGVGAAHHPPPPENLKLYYQVILISWVYVALHTSTVFISALQIIITNTIIGLGFVAPNICTFSTP